MDNFEPGMFRPPPASVPEKEDEKNILSGEEENTEIREDCQEKQEMLKPADPGIISSWSLSAGTSDLLFWWRNLTGNSLLNLSVVYTTSIVNVENYLILKEY